MVTISWGSLLVLALLLVILISVVPAWGHSRSWGYLPGGIVGTIIIILLLLLLLGRL